MSSNVREIINRLNEIRETFLKLKKEDEDIFLIKYLMYSFSENYLLDESIKCFGILSWANCKKYSKYNWKINLNNLKDQKINKLFNDDINHLMNYLEGKEYSLFKD